MRKYVVMTLTQVEILEINLDSLWYMLNVYPALDRRLSRMHELRALEAWKTMELNSCLRRLASFQRTQLSAVLETKEFKEGDELWPMKPGPRNAYLLAEGELVFAEVAEVHDRPFKAGAFLCDFQSMIQNRKSSSQNASGSTTMSLNETVMPTAGEDGVPCTDSQPSPQETYLPRVTLVAQTDCRLYQIPWSDAYRFLEGNPGVLVQIYHSYVVE